MPTLDHEGSGAGERAGNEHDPVAAHASPDATPIEAGGSRQALSPEAAAEMLRRRPDQRDALLARLHQTMGAAFVRQVIAVLETPSAPPSPASSGSAAPVSMSSLAEADDTATVGASSAAASAATPIAPSTAADQATPAASSASSVPSSATPAATASPSFAVPAVVRVTAADGLRVRRTPDATARDNVLGGLGSHEEIEALAREGEWLRVTYRGEAAFIHGGFVELAPQHGGGDAHAHAPVGDHPQHAHAEAPTSAPQAEPAHVTDSGAAHSAPSSEPHAATSAPAAHVPAAGVSTPTRQAEAAHQATAGEFTTLSGNAIAKTTAKEAEVLGALRADPRRFDPAWLVTAQRSLGVIDATGAMNTETLRAMRTRASNPSLTADGILNESFLSGIARGTPFFGAERGFADHAADAGAHSPADRAAQAAGYASFAEYKGDWVAIRFLGRNLGPPNGGGSGRGHPYLAARVHAAEAFLRQRHPGLDDEAVIRAIGWNGKGNAAYADEPGTQLSHQHTMGLAIDIDPAHNPYIFNETATGLPHDQAMWWIETFEEMFRVATKLYGGEPIRPDTLMTWSKESSSEELIQRVQATSNAFRQYLELSKKPKEEILSALEGAGYTVDQAKAMLPDVQKAEGRFHGGGGRQYAKTITNIQEELLVALRDVAGLSWGGTEMSMRENGDFMHFDCRNTTFGYAVYSKTAPRHR